MTEDRDPRLQSLFANAQQDLAGEAFTARVMSQTRAVRRGALAGWVCLVILLVAGAWLLAAPAQDGVRFLTRNLTMPLVTLDNPGLAQALSPINNITILLALGLIGLRVIFKRLFP